LPAAQLELSADALDLRVTTRVPADGGMRRCEYAVRAARLALAAVKTLASTGKRGASLFLATPVLLSGAEASYHVLSLIRSGVTP